MIGDAFPPRLVKVIQWHMTGSEDRLVRPVRQIRPKYGEARQYPHQDFIRIGI